MAMIPFTHEKDDTFESFDAIFEMANVAPEDHRFGVRSRCTFCNPATADQGMACASSLQEKSQSRFLLHFATSRCLVYVNPGFVTFVGASSRSR
ncbi:MAG: hypothetical protein Q7U44_05955 [Desulfuromonadales bacterium]|nr:hypothetical protein [Desulfuromonadales bacterium]